MWDQWVIAGFGSKISTFTCKTVRGLKVDHILEIKFKNKLKAAVSETCIIIDLSASVSSYIYGLSTLMVDYFAYANENTLILAYQCTMPCR